MPNKVFLDEKYLHFQGVSCQIYRGNEVFLLGFNDDDDDKATSKMQIVLFSSYERHG